MKAAPGDAHEIQPHAEIAVQFLRHEAVEAVHGQPRRGEVVEQGAEGIGEGEGCGGTRGHRLPSGCFREGITPVGDQPGQHEAPVHRRDGMGRGQAPGHPRRRRARPRPRRPKGTIFGSNSTALPDASSSASANRRPARRVGRKTVAPASARGSARGAKPSTSVPSSSAVAKVGRNGAEDGMVSTRGTAVPFRLDHCFDAFSSGEPVSASLENALDLSRWTSGSLPRRGRWRRAVPTCIQMPSRRRPKRRSASAALSKMRLREKAPSGVPSNSSGFRMAAPA